MAAAGDMDRADRGARVPPVALLVAALVALALVFAPTAPAGAAAPPSTAQVERRTAAFEAANELRRSLPAAPPAARAKLYGRRLQVALYGAPQLGSTAVGKRSPRGAVRLLKRQAKAYAKAGPRPVARTIDLIGVIATADRGRDGLYRTRQSADVIDAYLRAARSAGARLALDIQPGRSTVLSEMRALRPWLRLPDVDVAIDPEWNVGRKGVPGVTEGSIKAAELNRATAWLDRLIAARELPPKGLIVHQFREGSIRGRKRVEQGRDVEVLLNFDGIGSAAAKKAGYKALAVPGLFDGFSLFYDLDERLMRPAKVLRLRPAVEFVMYQ